MKPTHSVVFALNDLAAAGIGFDIAGALLLAKGLLVSAEQQFKRGASGFGGWSFSQTVGWAESWVDACPRLHASTLAPSVGRYSVRSPI